VDEFAHDAKIKSDPTPTYAELQALIQKGFDYRLDDKQLSKHPRLEHFRSVLVMKRGSPPTLVINPSLSERQRKFILAREIGYQVLGLKDRAMTSAPERVDSFEQVLNDFKASYFAGALLINRDRLIADI
jgi:Zn-dependent peptidase ImmA (M78 family)